MNTRQLTPQAISALLKKAGFARAVVDMHGHSGFMVTKHPARPGVVRVRHYHLLRSRQEWLPRYAEAIRAAGWTVETGKREVTVSAPAPAEGWREDLDVPRFGADEHLTEGGENDGTP